MRCICLLECCLLDTQIARLLYDENGFEISDNVLLFSNNTFEILLLLPREDASDSPESFLQVHVRSSGTRWCSYFTYSN